MIQICIVSGRYNPQELEDKVNSILKNNHHSSQFIDIKYSAVATGSNNDMVTREAVIIYDDKNY